MPPTTAEMREIGAVITEIAAGRGRVEVLAAGKEQWRQVQPLSALRIGDQLRVTEDAAVVIVLSNGRGSVRVTATDSPFGVAVPTSGPGKPRKTLELLQASFSYLSASARESLRAVLVTRSPDMGLVVLTPRDSAVLEGPVTFVWQDDPPEGASGKPDERSYSLIISTPTGTIFRRDGLRGEAYTYPAQAPRLDPGARYNVRVSSGRRSSGEVWFEVLDSGRATAVRTDLVELEEVLKGVGSPSARVTVRAGFLASQGLLHDARQAVVVALRDNPDEPALLILLGNLYSDTGLPELASVYYARAAAVQPPTTGRPPGQR
jgi:hypothetical protein